MGLFRKKQSVVAQQRKSAVRDWTEALLVADGYIVNTIMDACYTAAQTKKWEPVEIKDWRSGPVNQENGGLKEFDEGHFLIKEETMPDGKLKVILKDKQTGKVSQIIK